jgi:flagellar protein FlaG
MENVIMDIGALGNATTSLQKAADYQQPSIVPLGVTGKPAPVQTTDAVSRSAPAPSMDQVKQAVHDINKSMQALSRGVEFSIDTDTKQTVVKVIDPQTKEVIRQMPTQEALDIAKALDQVLGKLIKAKA